MSERSIFAERRAELDKTIREIARELEQHGAVVAEGTVGMWDRGVNFPRPKHWPAVCKVYGITQKRISDAAVAFDGRAAVAT